MDKYRRVPKEKEPQENIAENEVRITARGTVRTYISYSLGKLNGEGESGQRTIYLKAMGRTIQKAVSIAEIIKRRVAGLHQITKLDSNTLIDTFEPTVLGLDKKEVQRTVSTITITLSKDSLDEKDIGYQSPLPENLVVSEEEARADRGDDGEGGAGRGRGRRPRRRGGEGRGRGGDRDDERPSGRGRGRGGRGGRGLRDRDDERDYDSGRGERRGRGGRGGSSRGGRGGDRDRDGSSGGRGGDRDRDGGSGGRGGSSRGGRGGRGGDRDTGRGGDRDRDRDRDTGRGGGRGGYSGGRGGSESTGRSGGRGRGPRN